MSDASHSYRKVRYDLRPAKQVERMMLLDCFQRLAAAGFPIADYRYTGMGSIHFYDFMLFHRYLGIDDMLSVEIVKAIEDRIRFNKPFGKIQVRMGSIGEAIAAMPADKCQILWLDYDGVIRSDYLRDVAHGCEKLPAGSVILVTVDVEPPGKGLDSPKHIKDYYVSEIGDYVPGNLMLNAFNKGSIPRLNRDIIVRAMLRGLGGRRDVQLLPLVHFAYQDGHAMITLGGMIATKSDRRRVQASTLQDAVYYRRDFNGEPYRIHVPVITRKERHLLDAAMPCPDGWQPAEFALPPEDIKAYCEIYRYNPIYGELLT